MLHMDRMSNTSHTIPIRIPFDKMPALESDLEDARATSGVDIKLGAYARNAVLSYSRHRKMEKRLRDLREALPSLKRPHQIAAAIDGILEAP